MSETLVAHNVATRLKDDDKTFSQDLKECGMEAVWGIGSFVRDLSLCLFNDG